jgi:hypothetical protein
MGRGLQRERPGPAVAPMTSALAAALLAAVPAARPNIVFVMSDDHAAHALRAELQDDHRFADEQPPAGVDGTVLQLRGK